jgi:DNA (cytosine-5)-methyltransferase 1
MRLLDLFCKAGGAAMGYHRAGFDEIVGIDIEPQKRYPFEFVQCDALEYVRDHWMEFDAIHASPPCQAHSKLRHCSKNKPWHKEYPDLIPQTRNMLLRTSIPWVIENVVGARMPYSITLCGTMFKGLRVYRHRLFETSFFMMEPSHPKHVIKANGKGIRRKEQYEAGSFLTVCGHIGRYCGDAMKIDWMTGAELSQAIPPAYTEYIGRQLIDHIRFKAS